MAERKPMGSSQTASNAIHFPSGENFSCQKSQSGRETSSFLVGELGLLVPARARSQLGRFARFAQIRAAIDHPKTSQIRSGIVALGRIAASRFLWHGRKRRFVARRCLRFSALRRRLVNHRATTEARCGHSRRQQAMGFPCRQQETSPKVPICRRVWSRRVSASVR